MAAAISRNDTTPIKTGSCQPMPKRSSYHHSGVHALRITASIERLTDRVGISNPRRCAPRHGQDGRFVLANLVAAAGVHPDPPRRGLTPPSCRPSGRRFHALHTPRGHRKYLNADERRRFLAAADQATPELRTFCHLLAWSGCRLSEALDLHPADIDAAGSVAFRSLKKRDRPTVREVPVPDSLVALLAALPPTRGRCWLWARTTAYRHVKDVMAAAGIAGLHASPKGLRHGFGVHAVRAGVPLTAASSSPASTASSR